jgi:hypothetical protein
LVGLASRKGKGGIGEEGEEGEGRKGMRERGGRVIQQSLTWVWKSSQGKGG